MWHSTGMDLAPYTRLYEVMRDRVLGYEVPDDPVAGTFVDGVANQAVVDAIRSSSAQRILDRGAPLGGERGEVVRHIRPPGRQAGGVGRRFGSSGRSGSACAMPRTPVLAGTVASSGPLLRPPAARPPTCLISRPSTCRRRWSTTKPASTPHLPRRFAGSTAPRSGAWSARAFRGSSPAGSSTCSRRRSSGCWRRRTSWSRSTGGGWSRSSPRSSSCSTSPGCCNGC